MKLRSLSDQQIEAQIPRLRRFARSLVREHDLADDLVQETLLRALSRWEQLRRPDSIRAWLFQILFNLHRTEGRLRKVNQLRFVDMAATDAPDLAADQTNRLHLCDTMAAVRRLPEEQRVVLELVALEDMSYVEAAHVLGVPVGTVMSRLSRARDRLREELASERIVQLKRVK
jgi:RNA polymerase sigma-70 factor (ECF subfamily)